LNISVQLGTAVTIAQPSLAYFASTGMLAAACRATDSRSPSSNLGMPQQRSFSTSSYGMSLCSSTLIRSCPMPGSL
jgi:hypothetical protein